MDDLSFELETRVSLALAAARLGVWSYDVRSNVVTLDAFAAAAFGLPGPTETTIEAIDGLVHRDDVGVQRAALRGALDPLGGGNYAAELRIARGADGGEGHLLAHGRTEFRDGKPTRVIGVSRDVTESRRAENELRRSQAWLAGILSIAADAIVAVDARQIIRLYNHGAETTFGYTAAEAIGQPLDLLLPHRHRAAHVGHVRQFAAARTTARRMGDRREVFGLRKDGTEFPAEASISKLEIGADATFTIVVRDVTARKVFEAALAQANRDLEARVAERTRELSDEMARREQVQAALSRAQRMEAFGQLAGGLAHDFNNLLTVITGNNDLLEMRLSDPKDLALLQRSQTAAEMGARLTARLLTFARRRTLEPTLLDLNEQVTAMLELLRRAIGEHITLTTSLAPRLGTVRADASEIENAILNLAINARDAMPTGGTLVIETGNFTVDPGDGGVDLKLPLGDYVRIGVSDTGAGMTPDVLARAFEPFFTTKAPGLGTGLGLSTIYGFVELSGGTVTAYSELGRGTTINLYLPRVARPVEPAVPRGGDAVPMAGNGERVLLVEDRPDVREVTRLRLEHLGYRVAEAENGTDAIDFLTSFTGTVDLVFSDVVMPGGLSGYDVARWVEAHRPGIRVVLTSGFSEQVAAAHGPDVPNVRLLRKPHTRMELATALRDALAPDGGTGRRRGPPDGGA
jgi:PAS domain S-box-containing protein